MIKNKKKNSKHHARISAGSSRWKDTPSRIWWYTHAIPALGRLKLSMMQELASIRN